MIKNLNTKNRKDDIRILTWIIVGFLFVVWLCTPPGNKFLQICFWGNNTKLFIAKLTNNAETTEYKYHRNNAVYLVKMKMKKQALEEIDKAIYTLPVYISDNILKDLYRDRAQIRIYYGDYKGALDDYLRVDNLNITDRLRLALLFKMNGNNREALSYCNSIINLDIKAYAGYACAADIYAGVGRYDASIKVYDLLIDRSPNRAKYYADRAEYKKISGDVEGYNADMKKAKDISAIVDIKSSIIQETIYPKELLLSVK